MAPSSEWPHPPVAGGVPSGRRVQYAALPYRVRRDGEVQIRLITSRETRRWVIPKGWPIKGLTPPKTAARECYEEAGLVGVVSREPIGMYTYEKRLGTRSVLCDVLVFPLKVKRLLQKWPERFQRYGFWFSIETAAAAVQEEDLSELILSFGAIMARRREEKLAGAAADTEVAAPKAKAAKSKVTEADQAWGREAQAEQATPKEAGTKSKPSESKVGVPKAEAGEPAVAGVPSAREDKSAKAKMAKAKAVKGKVATSPVSMPEATDQGQATKLAKPSKGAKPKDAKPKDAKSKAAQKPGKTATGEAATGEAPTAKSTMSESAEPAAAAGAEITATGKEGQVRESVAPKPKGKTKGADAVS